MTGAEGVAIGRDAELSQIAGFLAGPGIGALVVTGAPGIGKTTIWEAALEEAAASGRHVLTARAAESALPLSFAGLADLFEDIDLSAFPSVPEPQRDALAVVLHRAEPVPGQPELSTAAALGSVALLRLLSAEQPLLVAIDDVTWLDRQSFEILAFAARRLGEASVRFLFTRRAGAESELEAAFAHLPVEQLELGALTLGAIRLLVAKRLGLNLPRRLLRRLYDSASGNPLLALELARSPVARDEDEPLALLPASTRAEDLFGARVAALPASVRRALLAVALSPQLTESETAALAGGDAVQVALAAGLLTLEGQRLRAAHPLLAAAGRSRSSSEERRLLHLELARTVLDPTRRLQHAALGAEQPDAVLAARLTEAAAASLGRGGLHEAIELGQHAVRLSPADDGAFPDRLLSVAEHLSAAGEFPAVAAVVSPRIDELPAGRARTRAHLLLGEAAALDEHERQLELALEQAAGEPDLVAAALSTKSVLLALIRVERIETALALAEEALAAARVGSSRPAEAQALHALAWARVLRGLSIEEPGTGNLSAGSLYASASERPAAVRLAWRGELDESRALLAALLHIAEERGEARSCVVLHLHRCELELRAGNTAAAISALDEWEGWTADEAKADVTTIRARCRALLAAVQGHPGEATFWADAADTANKGSGFAWDRLDVLRARGLAALQAADPQTAWSCLEAVWKHTSRAGIRDPGAFPVAGDLVEALLAVGNSPEASVVTAQLRTLAEEQQHPWGLATASRCDALLRLAEQRDGRGLESLEAVAADYLALGLHFDAARTLLAAGRAARRQRRWRDARTLVERSASRFDEVGADGWAETARSGIGQQASSHPGGLTRSEKRIAELVADGLSNKEVATRLTVSVSTVETHLKRIYRKLGVGSRTQLARKITAREESDSG